MLETTVRSIRSKTAGAVLAAAALVIAGPALVPEAEAGHKRSYKRSHHHKSPHYVHHHDVVHHTRFVVPRYIHPVSAYEYRSYYSRRVWHPAHGHSHVVYSFPVVTDVGVVYHPHTYCGPTLFASATIPLPAPPGIHVSINLGHSPGCAHYHDGHEWDDD